MTSFPSMDVSTREQWMDQPWYELAENFAEHRDQKALDPTFACESLEHFEPMAISVFAQAKSL